ncbi:retrotransposon protein, putative, ty1-copia subclass, partial [Tanacetum coccineum]
MASSMSRELQKTFENTYEMNQQLKEMFQPKASKERLDVVKSLMDCKPKPEASNCAFVLEMKGYFDILESLNMVFDTELSINIILSGLPADYNQFVLSYQMNTKDTSIMELHSLLQTTKQGIKKIKAAKGKFNRGSKRNAESEIAPTNDPKEAACFYCNTKGHWKRSCLIRSGYQQKGRKPSQNDKTEHGMEKTVQNQGQS